MTTVDFLAERKKRVHQSITVLCGLCKATGVFHVWDKGVLLPAVPTRKCPVCNGSGKFLGDHTTTVDISGL